MGVGYQLKGPGTPVPCPPSFSVMLPLKKLTVILLILIDVSIAMETPMDPYVVLGVSPGDPPEVVSAAFRKKAAQCHPDSRMSQGNEEEYKRIGEAYRMIQRRVLDVTTEQSQAVYSTISKLIDSMVLKAHIKLPGNQDLSIRQEDLEGLLRSSNLLPKHLGLLANILTFHKLNGHLQVLVDRPDFEPSLGHLERAIEHRNAEAFIILHRKMAGQHVDLQALLPKAVDFQVFELVEYLIDQPGVHPTARTVNVAILHDQFDLMEKILAKGLDVPSERFYILAMGHDDPIRYFLLLDKYYGKTVNPAEILTHFPAVAKEGKGDKTRFLVDWFLERASDQLLHEHSGTIQLVASGLVASGDLKLADFALDKIRLRPYIDLDGLVGQAAITKDYPMAEHLLARSSDPSQSFFRMLGMANDTKERAKVIEFAQRLIAISALARMHAYERLFKGVPQQDRFSEDMLGLLSHDTMSVNEMIHLAQSHDLPTMQDILPQYELGLFQGHF